MPPVKKLDSRLHLLRSSPRDIVVGSKISPIYIPEINPSLLWITSYMLTIQNSHWISINGTLKKQLFPCTPVSQVNLVVAEWLPSFKDVSWIILAFDTSKILSTFIIIRNYLIAFQISFKKVFRDMTTKPMLNFLFLGTLPRAELVEKI